MVQGIAKRHKYNAKPQVWCGECGLSGNRSKGQDRCQYCTSLTIAFFDSKAELHHFIGLRLRMRAGEIDQLEAHPVFEFFINKIRIGKYTADFQYWDKKQQKLIIEDVKGGTATDTAASKLRRKCAEAYHGIKINIIRR